MWVVGMNEDFSKEIERPEGPDPYSEMTVKIPRSISLASFIIIAIIGYLLYGAISGFGLPYDVWFLAGIQFLVSFAMIAILSLSRRAWFVQLSKELAAFNCFATPISLIGLGGVYVITIFGGPLYLYQFVLSICVTALVFFPGMVLGYSIGKVRQNQLTRPRIRGKTAGEWTRFAKKLIKEERWDEATEALRYAYNLEPENYQVLANLGGTLLMSDKLDEAEEILRKSIAVLEIQISTMGILGKSSEIEIARRQAGQCWYNLGHLLHIRARRLLDEHRKPLRSKVKYLSWQEHTWEHVGNFAEEYTTILKESEKSLLKAIELRPDDSKNWYEYGQVLHDLEKHSDAVKALKKAIELDQKCKSCWFSKGLAEAHMNELESAEVSFRKVLEFDQEDADAWWCLGATLQDLGRTDELKEVQMNLKRLGSTRWSLSEKM